MELVPCEVSVVGRSYEIIRERLVHLFCWLWLGVRWRQCLLAQHVICEPFQGDILML